MVDTPPQKCPSKIKPCHCDNSKLHGWPHSSLSHSLPSLPPPCFPPTTCAQHGMTRLISQARRRVVHTHLPAITRTTYMHATQSGAIFNHTVKNIKERARRWVLKRRAAGYSGTHSVSPGRVSLYFLVLPICNTRWADRDSRYLFVRLMRSLHMLCIKQTVAIPIPIKGADETFVF